MRLIRLVSLAAAVAVSASFAAPAPGAAGTASFQIQPTPPHQVRRISVVRPITFPVVGPARYEPSFGDCRDGCDREHHGVDIFSYGWKGVPVVAAHSGYVERAEVYGAQAFCSIHIRGGDGWETRYVHLNTDTPGTDDGAFHEGCSAPGVTAGQYVQAGQIIGWLGDSGNAERHSVHLHFEMRTPAGTPVDPWRSLNRAERVEYTMLDPMDPVAAAVTVSSIAYPHGAHVAFVTTVDEEVADGIGLPWTVATPGPILVTTPGALDATVRAELQRLAPDVIVVFDRDGESWRSLAADVTPLARAVDQMPFPEATAPSRVQVAGWSDEPPPMVHPGFRVIVVEERSEPQADLRRGLSALAASVPIQRLVQQGGLASERGLSVLSGPDRPGLRHAVYYPAGEGWQPFPLDGPEPEITGGFVVLVAGDDEVTRSTLTFLSSMATTPVTPYWR